MRDGKFVQWVCNHHAPAKPLPDAIEAEGQADEVAGDRR